MSDLELKKLKKRESNKRYQEKIKRKLEEVDKMSKVGSEPQDEDREDIFHDTDEEGKDENPDVDSYVLDKKTYLYLLEKAKQGERMEGQQEKIDDKQPAPPSQPKPLTEDPNSFFFQLKNSFKTTAISMLPVVTLQLMMHGGKLLTNSTSNSRSSNTGSQLNKQPQQHTMDYGLPVVNAL